jgi:hypothetical protein
MKLAARAQFEPRSGSAYDGQIFEESGTDGQ